MLLVKDVIKGCSTGQIDGLSKQVLERLLKKGCLVEIKHKLIVCGGRQNNPYLQPKAYEALVKAAKSKGRKIVINSCLRTVMQQYMLREQYKRNLCGITAAAVPGRSNHQSGLAIDIQDYLYWRSPLKQVGWHWLGAWDKWHFDYKGHGFNLGKAQIKEFQALWNENNLKQLAVDGCWGRETAWAVANSPVKGFGLAAIFDVGDMSKSVGRLQLALRKALGLSSSQLAADCKFGGQTTKAVMAFQRSQKLKVTGVADQKTLDKLGFSA